MIPDPRTPEEQRFLALCMLLMCDHPRIGASFLSVSRGEDRPYRKGWNVTYGQPGKTRTRWVLINDRDAYSTWRKPDIETSKVHEVDYTPPSLENTTAWKWASQLGPAHRSRDWAMRVLACIRDASSQMAFPHDPDAEYLAVDSALQALQQRASSFKDPDGLAKHLLEIMLPYVSLAQSGTIAASVLTAVLTNIVNFVSAGDPTQAQLDLRDTLGERMTSLLLHSRVGMRPGGFEQMTYLAALYGKAALTHSELVRSTFHLRSEQSTLLARWDQNVDELLAHEVFPYLVYFAMPSIERVLRLGEREWDLMSNKYGDTSAPAFDHEAVILNEQGPCTAKLLHDAVDRLNSESESRSMRMCLRGIRSTIRVFPHLFMQQG